MCMVAVGFVVLVSLHDELDQGWDVSSRIAGLDARVPGLGVLPEISSRDVELFFAQFWEKSPVIVRRATIDRNNNFREVVAKETLLQKFGDLPLLLSTANTASYQKKRVLLKDYVQHMMGAQDETVSGEGLCVFFLCVCSFCFGNDVCMFKVVV